MFLSICVLFSAMLATQSPVSVTNPHTFGLFPLKKTDVPKGKVVMCGPVAVTENGCMVYRMGAQSTGGIITSMMSRMPVTFILQVETDKERTVRYSFFPNDEIRIKLAFTMPDDEGLCFLRQAAIVAPRAKECEPMAGDPIEEP